jgi:hypothetical protein
MRFLKQFGKSLFRFSRNVILTLGFYYEEILFSLRFCFFFYLLVTFIMGIEGLAEFISCRGGFGGYIENGGGSSSSDDPFDSDVGEGEFRDYQAVSPPQAAFTPADLQDNLQEELIQLDDLRENIAYIRQGLQTGLLAPAIQANIHEAEILCRLGLNPENINISELVRIIADRSEQLENMLRDNPGKYFRFVEWCEDDTTFVDVRDLNILLTKVVQAAKL